MLLNEVLIPNLLNNSLASSFLMNFNFFLAQIVQFDTSINLFFCSSSTKKIFHSNFFTADTMFPLFLHEVKSFGAMNKSILSKIIFWYNGINVFATLLIYCHVSFVIVLL